MIRLALITLLALTLFDCGRRKQPPNPTPTPIPFPTATPTPEATPTPTPTPSPALVLPVPRPTPVVDLDRYLPLRPVGPIATVSGPGLAEAVQRAQDDPVITSVHITGGGSFTEPVLFRKFTTFDSSTYACDATNATRLTFLARLPKADADVFRNVPLTDHGCFVLMDGVYVGGTWRFPDAILTIMRERNTDPVDRARRAALIPAGAGTTILEPTFSLDIGRPSVEVFHTLGDVGRSHTGKARNIAIQGFRIQGRQQIYDGGVRSTVLLGNCERCAVTDVYLEDTASIGVTAGGSGLELNNFASDIVFTRNMLSGVAAANIATINTENAFVYENYIKRPGHHVPQFGGGVCGYDHETNSPADHTKDIWVYNNLFDYEDAHIDGAGNAICVQDPYIGKKPGENNVRVLNNIAVGGRESGARRFMSNGIYLVGLRGFTVAANYVFRTGQNAFQIYNADKGVIEDNLMDSTGGGGNTSFWSQGLRNTMVRRVNFHKRDIPINMQAGFHELCGSDNTYEDNFIPGFDGPAPATRVCNQEQMREIPVRVRALRP